MLDEPTNHLDERHRAGLLRLLDRFRGILVVVSRDAAFLDAVGVRKELVLGEGSHEKPRAFFPSMFIVDSPVG